MIKHLTAVLIFFSLTSTVVAQARLELVFDPDPLFRADNFTPGDQVSGQVTVTNNTDSAQTVIAAAVNIEDSANLSRVINLQIRPEIGPLIFDADLEDFFGQGETVLSSLGSGQSQSFNFTAQFKLTEANELQEQGLAFDLCIGFLGDESGMSCGNSVTEEPADLDVGNDEGSDENVATGGTNNIAGSSGGRRLIITNERVAGMASVSAAMITWQTNIPATSQVVYGSSIDGPYTLDLESPSFGYPETSREDVTKVTDHAVTLTGLIPGQLYSYRVVSRASPPTVSLERRFLLSPSPTSAQTLDSSHLAQVGLGDDQTGGVRLNGEPVAGSQLVQAGPAQIIDYYSRPDLPEPVLRTGNLAAVGFALSDIPLWSWLVILALLLFVFALLFWFGRSRNDELGQA